jgi:bacteriocin biosynthesis cyclodehydratase domain-containing protein
MTPPLPRIAPWYRVATAPNRVVLEYGQRIVSLGGAAAASLVPALLPLLDGTRTVDEIVRALGEPVRPAVERALERLDEHGVLLDGAPLPDDVAPSVAATADLLAALEPSRRPTELAGTLQGATAVVVGEGAAAAAIRRLLRRSGIRADRGVAFEGGADLVVCAPSPGELPSLRDWNRRALAVGQPWLQVLPFDGRYAAVGPLYLPDDTCCYECFRLRRAANLGAADELPLLEDAPAPYPGTPPLDALVAGLAGLLALQWLALRSHCAPAAFYAFELVPTFALALHYVHRVPRCPVCSGLADVSPPLPWHKEVARADG